MPKIKLNKTAVDAATPLEHDYELRDTTIPGFLVKVTPTGRKIFIVAYVAHNGQRRKPAIGRYGEVTVEHAREIARDWFGEASSPVPSGHRPAGAYGQRTLRPVHHRLLGESQQAAHRRVEPRLRKALHHPSEGRHGTHSPQDSDHAHEVRPH